MKFVQLLSKANDSFFLNCHVRAVFFCGSGFQPRFPGNPHLKGRNDMTPYPIKGSSRLRKNRKSLAGHYYLLTAATHERQPFFQDHLAAEIALESLQWLHGKGSMELTMAVIMPDHVHLVARMLGDDLGLVMHRFKSYTANEVNRIMGRQGAFWQPQYHDHALRADEDLMEVVLYCLNNPVRKGLVKDFHEYRHWYCCWDV